MEDRYRTGMEDRYRTGMEDRGQRNFVIVALDTPWPLPESPPSTRFPS